MDSRFIARCLFTALCSIQGIVTVAVDLNRTHATNPNWTGHARFHLVWQTSTSVILSILEVTLLWWDGPYLEQQFYLAAILAGIPFIAFLLALLAKSIYGGTLADANGVPPLRIRIGGQIRRFDMNVVAVIAGLLTLAVILWLFVRSTSWDA